jgi:hypothetical protein
MAWSEIKIIILSVKWLEGKKTGQNFGYLSGFLSMHPVFGRSFKRGEDQFIVRLMFEMKPLP